MKIAIAVLPQTPDQSMQHASELASLRKFLVEFGGCDIPEALRDLELRLELHQ